MTYGMLALGPLLLCVALSIISGLVYMFFTLILPLISPNPFSPSYIFHVSAAMFLLVNVTFNYFMCVMTKHRGESYDVVVRELAEKTDFNFPEDEEELREYESSFKKKMRDRHRRRRARMDPSSVPPTSGSSDSDSGSESDSRPSWVLLGSHEWSYCMRSNKPKPPRSHYDHVSSGLVLNMDHYCPWMANCVGYFNYRYFLNFLIYVFLAMVYAVSITYTLFKAVSPRSRRSRRYKHTEGLAPAVPGYTLDPRIESLSRSDRQNISFSFMICCAVGLGVFFLMSFHLYLAASAQSTIEFHGNMGRRRRARHRGVIWTNPYDLGWRRNLMQIYGEHLGVRALLPSRREPEYLPLPIPGGKGLRRRWGGKRNEGVSVDMGDADGRGEENDTLIQRVGNGRGGGSRVVTV